MVSYKELKEKYHDPHIQDTEMGWVGKNVHMRISVFLARFFVLTPITPNQVTMLWLVFGMIGCYLFSTGNYWDAIIACFIFQFTIVLDGIDGLVARFKKSGSDNGDYFEATVHTLTHDIFLVVGIPFGVFSVVANPVYFALGMSVVVCLLFFKIIYLEKFRIYVSEKRFKKIQKKKEQKESKSNTESQKSFTSMLRSAYAKFIFLYRGMSIMNLALLAAIFARLDLFLWFYGITFPLIIAALLVHEWYRGFGWVEEFFT